MLLNFGDRTVHMKSVWLLLPLRFFFSSVIAGEMRAPIKLSKRDFWGFQEKEFRCGPLAC